MSVSCEHEGGCGKTWERDPSLEVPCPTCGAGVGRPCTVLRPSEHKHSAGFAGLPPWGHDERDLAAVLAGAFGECPRGTCGLAARAQREGVTLEEMVEIRRTELTARKGKRRKQP